MTDKNIWIMREETGVGLKLYCNSDEIFLEVS